MLKKTIISSLMIGAVALAVASSGGGDKKKEARKAEFTPIRTTNGFTLKAGPTYTGSLTFGSLRKNNMITYNTVVTYQKGNSVYILPRHSRVSAAATPAFRSNLNLLDLKFRLHK